MPIYQFKCSSCSVEKELFRRIATKDDPCYCEECGSPMNSVICAPALHILNGYVAPSGRYISSPKQQRDEFARTNTRPYEGMASEEKEAKRRRDECDAKIDKKLEESLIKTVDTLPSKTKQLFGI